MSTLALLVVLFIIAVMGGMALYGIAIVRSSLFAVFVTNYLLIGIPAALGVSLWLASLKRD